jgi:hypothetical protein
MQCTLDCCLPREKTLELSWRAYFFRPESPHEYAWLGERTTIPLLESGCQNLRLGAEASDWAGGGEEGGQRLRHRPVGGRRSRAHGGASVRVSCSCVAGRALIRPYSDRGEKKSERVE